MLDKQIHEHLDQQEELEISVEDDIDALIRVVNVNKLFSDPETVLLAIVQEVKDNIISNYAKEATQNGIDFAKTVRKTKADIKIQRTNDPHLNKDDAKSRDSRKD